MAIPLPLTDNAGGIIVIKYTNTTYTHRMRFHVLAFGNDAAGTYTAPIAGGETTVQATFTAIATFLKPLINNTWTLTLDAVYQVVAGVATEVFTVTPPAGVAGTNGGATPVWIEAFSCWNFKTKNGHRMRFFIFQPAGWSYQVPGTYAPVAGGTAQQQIAAYFTGGSATPSAVVGHDGSVPIQSARVTYGVNKKLRRRAGDA